MKDKRYSMLMHPWTFRRIKYWFSLTEGRYSYVWKAEYAQSYADFMGWGING